MAVQEDTAGHRVVQADADSRRWLRNAVLPLLVLGCSVLALALVAADTLGRSGFSQPSAAQDSAATITGGLALRAADSVLWADATYTGDENTDMTAVVEYKRTADSAWTTAQTISDRSEREVSAAHVAGDYTFGGIVALDPNTSYDVRITFDDPDGLTGHNPLAGSIRTLPRAGFHGANATTYAHTAFFHKPPVAAYSDNTLEEIGGVNLLMLTRNDERYMDALAELATPPQAILQYLVLNELDAPASAYADRAERTLIEPGDYSNRSYVSANSFTYGWGDFADIYNLGTIDGFTVTENWFLHYPGDDTYTGRVRNVDATSFVMNPGSAGWRAFQRHRLLMLMKFGRTSDHDGHRGPNRFTGFFFDNVDSRPRLIDDTGVGTFEYGDPAPDGAHDAYRAAVKAQLDYLLGIGVYVLGNSTNASAAETLDVARHLNGVQLEDAYTTWSDEAQSYKSAAAWLSDVESVRNLLALGVDVLVTTQLVDDARDVPPDEAVIRFGYASTLLTDDRQRLFYRAADSTGTGYRRYRTIRDYEIDLGAPRGPYTTETVDGHTLYRRAFTDGEVRVNPNDIAVDGMAPHSGQIIARMTTTAAP